MKKKPITEIKKPNPSTRNAVIQTRLNAAEFKVLNEKAIVYSKGDHSKFIREAVLNYRQLTKKAV